MNGCSIQIDKIKVYITRSGYTGEDGFEISLDNENVDFLASKLLENNNVKLAGLGARDSLRLEAGLCLYGNELSTEINPIEANLRWIINPEKIDIENFTGSSSLVKEYREGADFIRVGIILKDRNLL